MCIYIIHFFTLIWRLGDLFGFTANGFGCRVSAKHFPFSGDFPGEDGPVTSRWGPSSGGSFVILSFSSPIFIFVTAFVSIFVFILILLLLLC